VLKYIVLLWVLNTQLVMAEDSTVSYLSQAKQVGDQIWIGPQTTKQDLDELANNHVAVVINSRTQSEMDDLGFNENDQLKRRGMDYGMVEIGKGHDYSPEKLAAFNDLMIANSDKKMVLHCRSGHRSSQLYAAWLIKYQGKTEDEALKIIQSDDIELTASMQALLGK